MASYLSGFKHLEIQLVDIKAATNDFDDSKVIGIGGFGRVYKGELTLPEGKSMVAFKRLDRIHGQGDPEFFKEIRMLSSYKHDNLISLLGYCKERDEMILIYEHASRGSLDQILNDVNLTWTHRLEICLGAAKGLGFLHDPNGSQQRVLHCDIKSANILLDETLNAKVADFGLSKISPANQKYTFLFTSPVGTPGYCDPLYMDTYQLTKESDVYSFGVVLFEVLCGRVCYKISNGQLQIFVLFWKKCYEQKKLDEIIFQDLKQHLYSSSVRTFVDIAYQCLRETREQRPTMSVVVKKLEAALEQREHEQEQIRKAVEYEAEQKRKAEAEQKRKAAEYEAEQEQMRMAVEQEYKEILKSADPPLKFLDFPVNGGKTLLHINDKGEVICERIYIEACLDPTQYDRLQDPSGFENSRFPRGRYYKHKDALKVRVRPQFLYPRITYSLNLVFRNVKKYWLCETLHYKLDRETKCCMVYNTYEREDGWFVVPLYKFTSDNKTVDYEINFHKKFCKIQIAGFEFQSLEEKVELHDQGLEVYQDIVKAASQPLFYESLAELKELLSTGFHMYKHKTWFSLNENGEHCEMLSIAHCLISPVYYGFDQTERYSRFPHFYHTYNNGFKVHIATRLLTPSIRYTVNLVLRKNDSSQKQKYVALKYKIKGETETSIVYLATETKDKRSFIAELYQFTSDGRFVDLLIVFLDHDAHLEVEGILFQPLEKVEREQVLEDEELSNYSLQRTMKEEDLCTNLWKWFIDYGQERYAVNNRGKKSMIFSARCTITSFSMSFKSSPESRFGEVAVLRWNSYFDIKKKIKSNVLSPETTYATYLIYKLPQDISEFKGILGIRNYKDGNPDYPYIYLVIPPETPFIEKKLDQNSHHPSNRPKLNAVPRKRKDGWIEVKVSQFQTQSSTKTVHMHLCLQDPSYNELSGLIIESIEIRPIVSHLV